MSKKPEQSVPRENPGATTFFNRSVNIGTKDRCASLPPHVGRARPPPPASPVHVTEAPPFLSSQYAAATVLQVVSRIGLRMAQCFVLCLHVAHVLFSLGRCAPVALRSHGVPNDMRESQTLLVCCLSVREEGMTDCCF